MDFARIVVNGRALSLDGFRGCFVVAMFCAHLARFVARDTSTPLLLPWRFVTGLEPAISAGFLFVVGVSLHLSWARALRERQAGSLGRWYLRLLLRALVLYLVGVLLFLSHYGFEGPDTWLSPDILSAIAFALVIVGAALLAGGPSLVLLLILVPSAAAFLEASGLALSGLNAGPGGALPLVAFSALGATVMHFAEHFGKLLVACVVATLVGSGLSGGWVTQVPSSYGSGAVTFWNHTAKGALVLAAPLVGAAWLFSRSGRAWSTRALSWVRLLGRHALLAYLVHLVVLEGSRRAGVLPLAPGAALGYLAGLVLGIWGLLFWFETPRVGAWLTRAGDRLGVRL